VSAALGALGPTNIACPLPMPQRTPRVRPNIVAPSIRPLELVRFFTAEVQAPLVEKFLQEKRQVGASVGSLGRWGMIRQVKWTGRLFSWVELMVSQTRHRLAAHSS
jgi:hypothetical protein